MDNNFWDKLETPIMVLAPMYNVTDEVFRQMITKIGKPDVMFTEFVSADGLANKKSREKLIKLHLTYKKNEHPIVAQIFGANVKTIYEASRIVKKLGFDGIDINMGCPDKSVVKSGQGSALIKNPKLALEIIKSAKDGGGGLPVSIKTRVGFNINIVEEWITELVKAKPYLITVHGRTKKEMSGVPNDWMAIQKAGEIARENGVMIIGNGDIKSRNEAFKKAKEYNLDGIMIGRGVLENLSIFIGDDFSKTPLKKRVRLMIKHARLFNKNFKNLKRFDVFKKHIGNYIFGFDGAREIRLKLMKARDIVELENICKKISF